MTPCSLVRTIRRILVSALMKDSSGFSETAADIRRPKHTDRFVDYLNK